MLLRTLESGEVFPVGAQSPRKVSVRVVAATDSKLEDRVTSGAFREPLFHRLSSFVIRMPPLRARKDDLGGLFIHFLALELERIGDKDRLAAGSSQQPPWLSPTLVARLAELEWPGNIRQLRNVARQLVIGSRGEESLRLSPEIERMLSQDDLSSKAPQSSDPAPAPAAGATRRRPSDVDEEELIRALERHRWDLRATSEHLRISRPSLYTLIRASSRIRTAGDLTAEEIADCHHECRGDLEAMVDRLQVSRPALKRRLRELGLA